MEKKTAAILFGGISPEHDISCRSAAMVLRGIDRSKYDVITVGITRDGRWIDATSTPDEIENGIWGGPEADFNPSRGENGGFLVGGRRVRPYCVYPVMHGENCEDGSLQGIFKVAGIPCVGCGVASSAVCMDKVFTKQICRENGIAQADYIFVRAEQLSDMDGVLDRAEAKFTYPVFVKPANTGSSVGVSKAKDRRALAQALETAAKFDRRILIEEFIDGYELEIAVIGNAAPRASGIGQILPSREFYSYEAKYTDNTSGLSFDPPISDDQKRILTETALKVYGVLDCAGLSRVDFFCEKKSGRIIFNEINTLPGFTSISMYPKLMERAGLGNTALITELIELAAKGR